MQMFVSLVERVVLLYDTLVRIKKTQLLFTQKNILTIRYYTVTTIHKNMQIYEDSFRYHL